MSYHRVIPRDLFNEAKLLKCLGQLALLAHDRGPGTVPKGLKVHHHPDGTFEAAQDNSDGSLWCPAITVTIGRRYIPMRLQYNSRSPYPLMFDQVEPVFNDDGTLSKEFVELCTKEES